VINSQHRHISVLKSNLQLDAYTVLFNFEALKVVIGGTRWHNWLRHCATSWKVSGSFPDGITGIFHWHNPSDRTIALGSTHPLTQMSIRNISCVGKGSWCVGVTHLSHSCADCLELWEPQLPEILTACPWTVVREGVTIYPNSFLPPSEASSSPVQLNKQLISC
jgi:hypothetical protein